MCHVDYFHYQKRPEGKRKTIAAFYYRLSNGGAERVVALLCNKWAEMQDGTGDYLYNVILITNNRQPEEKVLPEYHVNPRVKREYLPVWDNSNFSFADRFDAWSRICKQYDVDTVVSSQWLASYTFWDMLCVKGQPSKPAFIQHNHGSCSLPYMLNVTEHCGSAEAIYRYQLCDAVVVLSQCDKNYVDIFANRVRQILNPMEFIPAKTFNSRFEKNVILYVGRIDAEKHPLDVVRMMSLVVEKIPNAKLYMVGKGNPQIEDEVKALIAQLQLQNNVVLTGYQTDVEEYYARGRVLVSTSEIEGYPLFFSEAMAHAVPIVAYDLPYLTFMKDGRGLIVVPQKRYDALAGEVIKLLRDKEEAKRVGLEGKQQISELADIDIGAQWQELFSAIDKTVPKKVVTDYQTNIAIIHKYMADYHQQLVFNLLMDRQAVIGDLNQQIAVAQQELETAKQNIEITKKNAEIEIQLLRNHVSTTNASQEAMRTGFSFRIGRIVTFAPRKVRGALRSYKQGGIKEVVRLTKQRIKELRKQ